MNHRELESGYASYDVKDCKSSGKSLRYYKVKSHKSLRRNAKHEIRKEVDNES